MDQILATSANLRVISAVWLGLNISKCCDDNTKSYTLVEAPCFLWKVIKRVNRQQISREEMRVALMEDELTAIIQNSCIVLGYFKNRAIGSSRRHNRLKFKVNVHSTFHEDT